MQPLVRARVSLSGAIRAFVFGVCLAVLGISAFTAWHSRDVAMHVALREAQNLAASLAQQAADTMEVAEGALEALAERVETGGMSRATRVPLQYAMEQAIYAMPRLGALLIVDERGKMFLDNSSASERPDVDYSDREYFGYHRNHADRRAYVSGPIRSRSNNLWVIEVSRRLDHADGRFAGVAVAQISLAYFEQTYSNVDVGRLGVIDLVRDNSTILVRVPRGNAPVGANLAASEIFAGSLKYQYAGFEVNDSVVDGIRRLHAFRRLDRYPLVVIVGLAERDVLAEWEADVWRNAFATLTIVGLIAALGSVLSAQLDHRKTAEDTLARLALIDGLTAIANRRQFDSVLDREWSGAVRKRAWLALLMIDADHFKGFNDKYGHQRGDDVLIAIAATIVANIRPNDQGARYGGEEFAVVLPGSDLASAYKVAERIRTAIAEQRLPYAGSARDIVTISVGVASVLPAIAGQASTLVAAADLALYEAKRLGRDRSVTAPSVGELDGDPGVGEAEVLAGPVGEISQERLAHDGDR